MGQGEEVVTTSRREVLLSPPWQTARAGSREHAHGGVQTGTARWLGKGLAVWELSEIKLIALPSKS